MKMRVRYSDGVFRGGLLKLYLPISFDIRSWRLPSRGGFRRMMILWPEDGGRPFVLHFSRKFDHDRGNENDYFDDDSYALAMTPREAVELLQKELGVAAPRGLLARSEANEPLFPNEDATAHYLSDIVDRDRSVAVDPLETTPSVDAPAKIDARSNTPPPTVVEAPAAAAAADGRREPTVVRPKAPDLAVENRTPIKAPSPQFEIPRAWRPLLKELNVVVDVYSHRQPARSLLMLMHLKGEPLTAPAAREHGLSRAREDSEALRSVYNAIKRNWPALSSRLSFQTGVSRGKLPATLKLTLEPVKASRKVKKPRRRQA